MWRIARAFNGKVVSETKEGETNRQIWDVRATGKGSTRVVRYDAWRAAHAYAAHTFSFESADFGTDRPAEADTRPPADVAQLVSTSS